jgi:putative flavoprotein involved in K+ transport
MSHCLQQASVDHVVIDRGQVANSWRSERWDSLRLLTPNWMTRLPGHRYGGADPDGYMTATETAEFLSDYRRLIGAPVQTGTDVQSVSVRHDGRFDIATSQGAWRCESVVVATGAFSAPHRPAPADQLPPRIHQLLPTRYRNPDSVEGDRVLVVGGSATGVQLADELARAGREVTLATGHHVRVPRSYRGRNIHWWLDQIGLLDERWDQVDDLQRARRTPSFQLIGHPDRREVDLAALQEAGVRVAGRLVGVTDRRMQFSGSLANAIVSADLKMRRLLNAIDDHVDDHGLSDEVGAAHRPDPVAIPEPIVGLELADIDAVVWATGHRPAYPWLPAEAIDRKGAISHDGGVMAVPGMYALGLPFLRRRKSSFLDGVGADAIELAHHLLAHLDTRRRVAA